MSLSITTDDSSAPARGLDLDQVRIDPTWARRVPAPVAMRRRVLPLCRVADRVVVAWAGGDAESVERLLQRYLDVGFEMVEAEPESLRRSLLKVYDAASRGAAGNASQALRAGGNQPEGAEDAVALCDEMLLAALLRRASDIHLIPTEEQLSVQLRVDGQLESYGDLPRELQSPVVSRLKVLAGLDIAEKRVPQDGRFTARIGGKQQKVDIRAATLPTRHGERVTMRLLLPLDASASLELLGMSGRDLASFQAATGRPHGLVLLTGPTGCGKSTTLYTAIEQLRTSRGGNVITIEDPVEYEMPGVTQVEVDSADKVNFSKALRSILRHDPDVIMIGEIRDSETAEIAIKASLTGHLVFSTLHTNTAAGVVTRLVDLGVEPFLIAETLRLSVAQRLVRRLCPHCREPRLMSRAEAQRLDSNELTGRTVYEPKGCVYCAGRGYCGRIALFEMLESNEKCAAMISAGVTEVELLEGMRKENQPLLVDDGIEKILSGTTTVQEVLSAVAKW